MKNNALMSKVSGSFKKISVSKGIYCIVILKNSNIVGNNPNKRNND